MENILFDILYTEIGKLTIEFEQMNLFVRSCIRHIEKVETREGYDKIMNLQLQSLYRRFKRSLKKAHYDKDYTKDLYGKLEILRGKRNNIIHSYCLMGYPVINMYNVNGVTKSIELEPTASFFSKKNHISYSKEDFEKLNNECKELSQDIFKLSKEIAEKFPLKLYETEEEYSEWLKTKEKKGILDNSKKIVKKTLRKFADKI
jgi:hypothetical protein